MAKRKKIVEQYENFGADDYDFFKSLIDNDHGDDALQDVEELKNPKANSTGSFTLDIALGIPIPEGRIIEIYGGEGSGKTSLCLEILGAAQQAGKRVAYLNVERNLNRSLIDGIRTLDPSKKDADDKPTCLIIRGRSGEKCLDIAEKFMAQFPGSVIAIDSVDALVPECILQGNVGDPSVGRLAKLMSDACRRMTNIAEENDSTAVFVNQVRERPGVMYGNPEVTPGGLALRFYASQRIRFSKPSKQQLIVNDDRPIGHIIRFNIIKNKIAPPYIEGQIPLIYGKGIWRERELAQIASDLALVETGGRGGKQLKLSDDKGFMSRDKFAEMLEFEPAICKNLIEKVRQAYEI